ncbi:DNA polymerase III subunit gamma/tau [Marinicella rhabdoformis]|uniref:DNA polymerase III subunit gamma/tau n=1 Tax=Marinicella rhabdoformis TaxID=2580566 RepID=UPI0012AEBCD9|nr:DNA polymerase III subunit gamma/tau [Marinicella rhabdoformis]
MTYQALARKYRPQNFQEIVGQEHVVQALVNGLENNRLHHAFLFTGTRGVGKTTLARVLAKSLNCLEGVSGTPCGVCTHCEEIKSGEFIDLIEVDAASRTGVDDTRALLENVHYSPSKGRYKIYLIDEVHMFSKSSFNALLKTLEEPPEHVKFLLATTEPDKLPITVLSRCLQFNLKRLTQKQISDHLVSLLVKENVNYDDKAIALISRVADGSMRDSLSLMDQSLAFGAGQVTYDEIRNMLGTVEHSHVTELMKLIGEGDHDGVVAKLEWLHEMSIDYVQVLEELCLLLHEVALIQQFQKVTGSAAFDVADLKHFAQALSAEAVQMYYQLVMLSLDQMRMAPNKKISFEMAIIRMLAFEVGPYDSGMNADSKKNTELKPVPEKTEVPQAQIKSHQAVEQNNNDQVTEKPVDAVVESHTQKPSSDQPVQSQPQSRQAVAEQNQSAQTHQPILSFEGLTQEMWLSAFPDLPLKGSTREMARHFELLKNEANTLTFAVDTQAQMYLSDKSKQVFEQILQVEAQGFQLIYQLADEVSSVAKAQALAAQQQQQQLAPHKDPVVSELQQQFGATVIENKFGTK